MVDIQSWGKKIVEATIIIYIYIYIYIYIRPHDERGAMSFTNLDFCFQPKKKKKKNGLLLGIIGNFITIRMRTIWKYSVLL